MLLLLLWVRIIFVRIICVKHVIPAKSLRSRRRRREPSSLYFNEITWNILMPLAIHYKLLQL